MVHGANTVTLSKETESNRENKPAPKDTKAHIYSTCKKSDEGIVGGNPEGRNVRRDVVNEGYLAYRRRQELYT